MQKPSYRITEALYRDRQCNYCKHSGYMAGGVIHCNAVDFIERTFVDDPDLVGLYEGVLGEVWQEISASG